MTLLSLPCHRQFLRLRLPSINRRRSLATLGIRREDPNRIWERRSPLTPQHVEQLLKHQQSNFEDQIEVEVESCQRRCFQDAEFAKVGAKIVPRLSEAVDVVLGIKEPPLSDISRLVKSSKKRRTWMMFSHTHKGQAYNTPLLSSILNDGPPQTLIDHELLTVPSTSTDGAKVVSSLKRIAGFGWFAGAVGAGEALSLSGLGLLKRGIASPLLHLPRPYTFDSLASFKKALNEVGEKISKRSENRGELVVIGLTGGGNVADGAKAMLDEIGVEWIDPRQLAHLGSADVGEIYACSIPPSSYFQRVDDESYSREDYYANPQKYRSVFAEKIAPFLTTLINGAGWQTGFPRLMTKDDMKNLSRSTGDLLKLVAIQDVSCDLEGGLEFVNQHTTIDQPFFESERTLISSIDILPTELATDASRHFSSCILPYIRHLLSPKTRDGKNNSEEIKRTLARGTIIDQGVLTERHQWLGGMIDNWWQQRTLSTDLSKGTASLVISHSPELLNTTATGELDGKGTPAMLPRKKKVLLLGSGLVAGPAVDVFVSRGDISLAIASNNSTEASNLARGRADISIIPLDVSDEQALSRVVSTADVVVSLLPAPMHTKVAKHCIDHGKHMVTASYISPEMQALDKRAREKDVLLLGECGLDPGIDSMAAMRILSRVKKEGKRVTSFVSWCGGLPEPSASNVPLGYKFSWSPKAVLTAALNDARYKLNGEVYQISGDQLLQSHFPTVPLWRGLALEGLANRDSIPYAKKYGMGEEADLIYIFRGTLRYQGFSRLLDAFRKLGLLSSKSLLRLPEKWEEVLRLSVSPMVGYQGRELRDEDMSGLLSDLLGQDAEETINALRWLSLLPTDIKSRQSDRYPPLPANMYSPIDLFAHLLSRRLAYKPGENDTILLHHTFKLRPNSPSATESNLQSMEETVKASLICTGTSKASAMSVTVGMTLAFAACRVLDGSVKGRGVRGPYEREVWEGVLADLEGVEVELMETWG